MIRSETTSRCSDCGDDHPARYTEENGQLWFCIACPKTERRTLVSSDPALLGAIRRKAGFDPEMPPPFKPRQRFYFIEITEACNMRCPICYADAAGEDGSHLPLAEVLRRGRMAAEDGGRWISLTGGEPTLHPDLPRIITGLKRMGLSPSIVTNGLKIAEDPDYALTLKRAGLGKVQMQFDTLRNDTYSMMRGRSDVEEKSRAIDAIRRAGLRLGLVTTVCAMNIGELRDILARAVSLAPMVNTLILQSALPVGRFPPALVSADREMVIHELTRQGTQFDIRPDDFWPLPQYAPWQGAVHPDCSANLWLSVDPERAWPIGRDIDIAAMYARLTNYRGQPGIWGSTFYPLLSLLRATVRGKRLEVLRRLLGMRSGRGRRSLLTVSVGSYMHALVRDEQRLSRCSTCSVTESGLVGVCERSCTGIHRPQVVQR